MTQDTINYIHYAYETIIKQLNDDARTLRNIEKMWLTVFVCFLGNKNQPGFHKRKKNLFTF